ncbi:hypothetical protein Goarm_019416, partial [Gossypium armourianum]|nr:hypothetical protein [Gossypium armourianum]
MEDKEEKESPEDEEGPKSGGGWGGWVFSTFSVLSDLQKAAEEIALNASGVAENAAKTIADTQAAKTIGNEQSSEEDRLLEEVSFNQCFYIYGGSEQLEEPEASSSHYALLFNRRKTTLPPEQKSMYEGKLKEIQQIFTSDSGMDGNDLESAKGKTKDSHDEVKILHDSSIRKYADMAVGFINALAGLAVNDIIQRTIRRLESLHPEGVH